MGRGHATAQEAWKSDSLLGFFYVPWRGGVRCPVLAWKAWKPRCPAQLLLEWVGWRYSFFCGFGWSKLLLCTRFLSCQAVPFLVLWVKSPDFPWGFKNFLRYMKQKENPCHHGVIPWFLRSMDGLSSPFHFQILPILVLHAIIRLSSVVKGKNREKDIYNIFLETEVKIWKQILAYIIIMKYT